MDFKLSGCVTEERNPHCGLQTYALTLGFDEFRRDFKFTYRSF